MTIEDFEKNLKNNRMALDATPDQMKAFISMCFRDKNGKEIPKSTLDTCFQEDRPEKRAVVKKVQLDEYFKHED